ncbi:hypothetical protein RN001_009511 [Aquatica leii]|uniref:Regulatory protein zeste n=1 Tax=Aquatica leii TaxID=1421715 RepID=A0AAN7SPZ1_9COLE|nr:hypothetical protein RN001_009511 [Aquatica leii]
MNGTPNKKERGSNFTDGEITLLVELAIKHSSTIECAKSDAVTWKQKVKVWEQLTAEFNSASGHLPKTTKSLKIKYDGIKKDLRKKKAANRQQIFITGGGTSDLTPLTTWEEKLLEIILLSCEGLPATNDCDTGDFNLTCVQSIQPTTRGKRASHTTNVSSTYLNQNLGFSSTFCIILHKSLKRNFTGETQNFIAKVKLINKVKKIFFDILTYAVYAKNKNTLDYRSKLISLLRTTISIHTITMRKIGKSTTDKRKTISGQYKKWLRLCDPQPNGVTSHILLF